MAIIFYECITGVNIQEGEELVKLKDTVGTRTDEHKLAVNKFRLEVRRFLSIRKTNGIWNSFQKSREGKNPNKLYNG